MYVSVSGCRMPTYCKYILTQEALLQKNNFPNVLYMNEGLVFSVYFILNRVGVRGEGGGMRDEGVREEGGGRRGGAGC